MASAPPVGTVCRVDGAEDKPSNADRARAVRTRREELVPDSGPDTDAVSEAALRRLRFTAPTSQEPLAIDESSRRLLAFRITQEVLSGARLLKDRAPVCEAQRRADTVFATVLDLVMSVPSAAVLTAEVLLKDGYSGTVEDLLQTSTLLSE